MLTFLKVLLIVLACVISLVLLYIIFLLALSLFIPDKESEKDSKFFRALINFTLTVGLKLFRVKIHLTGEGKIPKEQRFLIICNHRSNYDPIVKLVALKRYDLAFLSKDANFKIPVVGKVLKRCCFLKIDRQNARNALKAIDKASQLIKNNEVSIGVYPEGTRSKNCELLPFHNGVLKIAKRANAPLVIATVRGTELIHKQIIRKRTDVYIDILEVVSASEVSQSTTAELGERARELMQNSLK